MQRMNFREIAGCCDGLDDLHSWDVAKICIAGNELCFLGTDGRKLTLKLVQEKGALRGGPNPNIRTGPVLGAHVK